MSPQPPHNSQPATSRYQSQVLNFINRQSQRFRDQGGIFLRRVKQATLWGSQIALYPIYALFQATRVASRQIGTKVRQAMYQLRPAQEVQADLSVTRVLDALNPTVPDSETAQSVRFSIGARPPQLAIDSTGQVIHAVASSLETHQLLLVTDDNVTLDILSLEQQQQLQARIVWELASYWKLWRRWQQYVAARQLPGNGSEPLSEARRVWARSVQTGLFGSRSTLAICDRPHLVAPVRFLYQLMAWVQQGPLASQINLFGETAMIDQPQIDWFQPHLGQLPTNALIRSNRMTQFDWTAWSEQLPQTNPITRLIKAAIQHFFGNSSQAFKSAAPMPDIVDPWDSPIDAEFVESFQQTDDVATVMRPHRLASFAALEISGGTEVLRLPTTPIAAVLPPIAPPQSADARSLKQKFGQKFGGLVKRVVGKVVPRQRSGAVTKIPVTAAVSESVSTAPQPSLAAEIGGSSAAGLTWSNVFSNDLTTTLIDTVATPIGYVQHPLERILGWLDHALLWLETQLTQLWQWAAQQVELLRDRAQAWWQRITAQK